jgi:hypothetical protein
MVPTDDDFRKAGFRRHAISPAKVAQAMLDKIDKGEA